MCLRSLFYYLLDVAILLHRRLIVVGPFVLLLFIDRVLQSLAVFFYPGPFKPVYTSLLSSGLVASSTLISQ